MRTPVPKSIPIIQRRFGMYCCPALTTFMTPSTQRTAARDRGRLERAEYAQMPPAQLVIFEHAGPTLCGIGSASTDIERIGLPADTPPIVAQHDPNCHRTGSRRGLPPIVTRYLEVGTGAAGSVRIESATGGKPGDGDPFAL